MNNIKFKLPGNWKILTVWLLLAILGFSIYANVLTGGFIWDDEYIVQKNKAIRDLSGIPLLFMRDINNSKLETSYSFYRPLVMSVYAIGYSVLGLNVKIYHFINIFIHILTALSVYYLVCLLFRNQIASLFCGLLFLVHPVQTEAVAYISGLADPLSALFIIWSFIFYIEYLRCKKKVYYIFFLISYVLALFSKENSLILMPVLLLYHYAFKIKFGIKQFFSILFLALLYLFLRVDFLKAALPNTDTNQSVYLLKRIPGFFAAITNYIRILFLPVDLHMEYGNNLFQVTDLRVIAGAVISSGLWIYAYINRNKNKLFFFSVSWFFITLLPCSSIYPVLAFYMSEHWLYLPSIGFFIIISQGLADFYLRKKTKLLTAILVLALLVAYSLITIKQNNYWKDQVTFYKRTLKYSPWSPRIYYNLGRVYQHASKYDQAIDMYKKAMEIKPDYGEACFNLALVYFETKQYQQAIEYCDKALKLNYKVAPHFIELLKPYRDKDGLKNHW